jgi:hypothetical protein
MSQGAANQPPQPERRGAERRPIHWAAHVRQSGENLSSDRPGVVLDISAKGIGLTVSRRFHVGTILAVTLEAAGGGTGLPMMARVIHVREEGTVWFHGCELARPLTEAELNELLTRPRP